MASLEILEEQFGRLKEVEGRKDQLIEELFSRVKEIDLALTAKKLHLEREQECAKLYQSMLHDAQLKLRNVEESIDSNSFVSVLIDGDGMLFCDDLVKSAQQGGIEAVSRLRSRVCESVSRDLELSSHIQLRVRIYANLKGLASMYCYNKILDSADDLYMFVCGFNKGHPMFDLVDAGDGKECADAKLKAWFDRDMADVQCRAVIFGGSADDSHSRLLQPYVQGHPKSNQIILIEGPPFAKELAELKNKVHIACFPDVFRNTKILPRRISFSTVLPPNLTTNAPSYAATIGRPADADAGRTEEGHGSVATLPARRDYLILQNSKGQRLDALISPPQSLVNTMRTTKYCNMFHVLGECNYINCIHLHGKRLDEAGIEARRFLLRQTPCLSGLKCKDAKCLLGHQCPNKLCAKMGRVCRFAKEMHNVDRA
ncbi:C-x8-C-x5-C-x3-H type zinc finger protein-like protein [Bisporella sp. PMI_857]|nr:C-x8-C-x5-C-x3-H type zinc finger protein-like protein [Bisporella sp. PMI_857]